MIHLVEIPGVPNEFGDFWRIRALEINGTSLAIAQLADLAEKNPKDFKKIRTALRAAAKEEKCPHTKYVKPCRNAHYPGTFEAIAYALNARLMFFYCEHTRAIVCTNLMWKAADNQDKACHDFKDIYDSHAPKNPKSHR
jgi:hypothetical protein